MPRPERSYRTPALILKRRDYGEADRVLTVLTPDYGKRDVIAKGARKPTSSKTGHVELFTRVDMLVARGRTFDVLTQVELVEPYLGLREDLQRGAYAAYAVELLDRFVEEGDEDSSGLFVLLDAMLGYLNTADDPRLVVRYYEMRLLDLVGFRPELSECVMTHEPVQPQDQFFSYAEGGVVSPAAAQHGASLLPVSVMALKLMRHLQRSPYAQVRELQIPAGLHQDVERLMLGYITFLLERRLQSVDFIRRIRT